MYSYKLYIVNQYEPFLLTSGSCYNRGCMTSIAKRRKLWLVPSSEFLERLEAAAEADGRSLSTWILQALMNPRLSPRQHFPSDPQPERKKILITFKTLEDREAVEKAAADLRHSFTLYAARAVDGAIRFQELQENLLRIAVPILDDEMRERLWAEFAEKVGIEGREGLLEVFRACELSPEDLQALERMVSKGNGG